MKHLFIIFLLLLTNVGFAANSATVTEKNVKVNGTNYLVQEVVVVYDTVDTDLTLLTPATGNSVALVGAVCVEADEANIIFKSGSTTKFIPQFGANSGLFQGIGKPVPFGDTSEAVKINSNVALTTCSFYLVEYDRLIVNY